MFLDANKNVCKMSNHSEIDFYVSVCPETLKPFVPGYISNFWLRRGLDKLDLDEEFDMSRYCPTASVLSKSSSQSSVESPMSLEEL